MNCLPLSWQVATLTLASEPTGSRRYWTEHTDFTPHKIYNAKKRKRQIARASRKRNR